MFRRVPPSPVRFWFASGLLLPGAVTLALAAVDVHAVAGSVPWPFHLAWIWGLCTVLILPLVRLHEMEHRRAGAVARDECACAHRSDGHAVPPAASVRERVADPEPPGTSSGDPDEQERPAARVRLLSSRALAPGCPRRILTAATFVVSAVVLVPLWWAPLSPATGPGNPRFMEFSPYGLALGATGVVLALCVFALSPAALRGSRRSRAVGAGAGFAAGAAAVALTALFTTLLPVDATTALPAEGDHDLGTGLPATVDGVGWRWSTPDGGPVLEVARVRTGVLVRSDEGIALLDGGTGEERWRYRRSGERAVDMQTSPGATNVMLTYPARDVDGSHAQRLVVLEADTGQEIGEYRSPSTAQPMEYRHQGDPTPLVHRDVLTTLRSGEGRATVAGYVPETGRERWTYEPLGDCSRHGQDVTRHEIVVLLECDMDIMTGERGGRGSVRTLHGLVPSTGTWLWHTDVDMSSPSDEMWVHTSEDGHLFAFAWASEDGMDSGNVLFGRNGEVVARDLPGFGGRAGHEGPWLFTTDGYLTWDGDGGSGTYTWRGLDGGEWTASAGETPASDDARKERIRPVPLDDALVTAAPRATEDESETVTLAVRPWAEGEEAAEKSAATTLHVTLEPASGHVPEERTEPWVSLHGVPGGLVLARPGSSEVVGIV